MIANAVSQRGRRARLIATGLCIQCGNGHPAPGRRTCVHCLELKRAYDTAQRAAAVHRPKSHRGRDVVRCSDCGGLHFEGVCP